MRQTVAVDFDGVIHRYSKGWSDGTAYDVPMPGAIDGLKQLMKKYNVYIFTTRNLRQVEAWFKQHTDIPTILVGLNQERFQNKNYVGLSNRKLVAILWIDDRVLKFEGDWARTLEQVEEELHHD